MWVALNSLWQRVRIESGGHAVNLPLVGSGLSGLGLPTRDLLNLIILSAITETKAREVTQGIRIVLRRDRFDRETQLVPIKGACRVDVFDGDPAEHSCDGDHPVLPCSLVLILLA